MKTIHINLKENNIFFTSDSHFLHSNIIKYCDRPFNDVHEMDDTLIKNWNAVIDINDVVFHLGDFCMGGKKHWRYYLDQLNGKKYLIVGNHDKYNAILTNEFIKVSPLINIMIRGDDEIKDGQRITLCHYPMISWYQSHRGAWQLFGHVHGTLIYNNDNDENRITPNQLDVGVDAHEFTPISYNQVKHIITKQNLEKKW